MQQSTPKRTVLVAGASRNIGKDLCLRFGAAGYNVVACARGQEALDATVREVQALGAAAIGVTADVRSGEDMAAVARAGIEAFGGVDVLINNAVARVERSILEMTEEEWHIALDTTLTAAFHGIRATLPGMLERGWGRIISMGGVAGQRGTLNRSGSVAAKSGIFGLSKAVALEVAGQGVTVNVVSPGVIDTQRGEWTAVGGMDLSHYDQMTAETPMGRRGRMSEVSGTCLFLASEDAAFITGQVIAVNGGIYM